jgi:2-polyprenyl-6-methoxyphenol hydroxylase-like FAD-dependent oxidoreductase
MAGIRHVVVIGAGLAGLACALAAASAGARVEVFESRPSVAAPPAHIDVVPNLLRDLVSLGVADECVRLGFPYQGIAVVDTEGKPLAEIATPRLAGLRYPCALGMRYADLLGLLCRVAQDRGARVHWGVDVAHIGAGAQGSRVKLNDRQEVEADLIVIASGHGASLRASLPLPGPALERLPQAWWHVLLPRPPALDRTTWVIGHDVAKVVLVPVSVAEAGLAVLMPAAAPGDECPLEPRRAALRRMLQSHRGLVSTMVSHLRDDTRIVARPVLSAMTSGPWHVGNLLCVGDRAHAIPPHFGQSAAQAVEDAVVLGDLLRTEPDVDGLLRAFMARRAERARQVHAVASQAARWDVHPEASTDLRALAARLDPIVSQPA